MGKMSIVIVWATHTKKQRLEICQDLDTSLHNALKIKSSPSQPTALHNKLAYFKINNSGKALKHVIKQCTLTSFTLQNKMGHFLYLLLCQPIPEALEVAVAVPWVSMCLELLEGWQGQKHSRLDGPEPVVVQPDGVQDRCALVVQVLEGQPVHTVNQAVTEVQVFQVGQA